MQKIQISLIKPEDRSYNILLEEGIIKRIPALLHKSKLGIKYAIISDENVAELYGKDLIHDFESQNIQAHLFTFKPGESSKALSTVERLLEKMGSLKFDRKDAVIALGGGVSGDIAGFIASIYMRGIPFVQIPTSLLAMVDSSIGGKTGVNLKKGKNLAGTFYQPRAVYIDPSVLATLPKEELINGLSEIIKCGVVYNKSLFDYVEKNYNKVCSYSSSELLKLITLSIDIKAKIVEKDEKETGLRMILNYGHTIGHALETISTYKISHGQAVSAGMIIINKIATAKGYLSAKNNESINNLITKLGLNNELIRKYLSIQNTEKLWSLILKDKKATAGKVHFIVPTEIGKVKIVEDISLINLKDSLKGVLWK